MQRSQLVRFLLTESLLIYAGFAIAAFVSPTDVMSQLIGGLVILVVTVLVSYWAVYRRGLPV
ncbi:MAG: hypothetical protein ABEH61_01315 [Haloarculaceae archaeon]